MDEKVVFDRISGSLLGGAAGDALGYAVEFMSWDAIARDYGANGIESYELSQNSGKALVSDDTQMTLYSAAGALAYAQACPDAFDLAALRAALYDAYLHWYRTQYPNQRIASSRSYWLDEVSELRNRRAPGSTCLSALGSGRCGSISNPLNSSKGCGGVMRVAPLGCFRRSMTSLEVAFAGAESSAITHGHSLGYIPGAMAALLVHKCVFRETERSFAELAREAFEETFDIFGGDAHWATFHALVETAFELARSDGDCRQHFLRLGEGWVGEEALAVALYCALRWNDDFDRCLISSVNHDGDSDSTGAIAGNLLGAYLGCGRVAEKWLAELELRDVIERIARELCQAALR